MCRGCSDGAPKHVRERAVAAAIKAVNDDAQKPPAGTKGKGKGKGGKGLTVKPPWRDALALARVREPPKDKSAEYEKRIQLLEAQLHRRLELEHVSAAYTRASPSILLCVIYKIYIYKNAT